MSFDPKKPIDAVFAKFGVDATFDPATESERTVRVLADRSTADGQVAGFEVQSEGGEIRIRAADASGVVAGTLVLLSDPVETRKLTGAPRYSDRRRLVQIWSSAQVGS